MRDTDHVEERARRDDCLRRKKSRRKKRRVSEDRRAKGQGPRDESRESLESRARCAAEKKKVK